MIFKILKSILKFFKSIRLAIFLIVYIILTCILATLIPQGLELKYYHTNYHSFLSKLILFFHFNNFFYSVTFLLPSFFFLINITSCTVYRIFHRQKYKLKKRYGPDLIHIGIILLILSSAYSLFFREEGIIYLDKGDKLTLDDGFEITLKEFNIESYSEGGIKDWVSSVEIRKHNKLIKEKKIEVNKPCAFANYKIYQYSFKPLTEENHYASGLKIVKDNSYIVTFSAIFLIILGLTITYYIDLRGEKK